MTIVSSLIAPIIDRTIILKSIISRSIKNLITRHFTNFDPVAQTYGEFLEPYVFTGDFEVAGEFAINPTVNGSMLFSGGLELYMHPDGDRFVIFHSSGTQNIYTDHPLDDKKLHTFELYRSTAESYLKIDGIKFSLNDIVGSCSVSHVCSRSNGTFYYGGIASNLGITDLSAPEPVTDFYPLDTLNDYELGSESSLGEELWTSPTLNSWVDNGDGSYSSINQSTKLLSKTIPQTTNSIIFKCEISDTSSGAVNYRYVRGDDTVFNFILNATDGVMDIILQDDLGIKEITIRGSSTFIGNVSNISVKEIQGNALLLNNVDHSETELVTLDEVNERWIGENRLYNGTFEQELDGWNVNGGTWYYENSSAKHAAGDGNWLTQNNSLTTGCIYEGTTTVEDVESGSFRVRAGDFGQVITSSGDFVELITALDPNFGLAPDSSFVGSISSVSVKRIINIAPQAE